MLSSLAPLEQRKKLHKEEGVVPGFPNAKAPKKQQSLKEGEKKKEEDDEKDEEEKMLKLLKKSEEKEKELKEMSAAMGMEEALCGDEPLIVPEFEGGSHETLYLEGSFSELEFPTASAACCGDVGFTRLFKLEDLLALEDTQGDLMAMTMEQEAPRVLQQGPDGHFDWVSATIDLDQMPHFEAEMMIPQHEDEFGSSRMPSPSPGFEEQLVAPLPLPASSSSSTPSNKKRKAVAPPVEAPLPVLAPKKRKIGVVMDDEEKRQRNRVSALKYRQKQRSGAYVTEDRIVDLERENQLLHFEIMKEKQAIAELRQLLTKHGVL